MGTQRFTISVLGVHRNDERKYLPEAFTMSFWDVKSGELKQSLAYWNSWRRLEVSTCRSESWRFRRTPKGPKPPN